MTLKTHTSEVIPGMPFVVGLEEKLNNQKAPLRVKLGFDPTSPDLHLGHFVVLRAARWFQDRGDEVHIIVGDFTASIGDPSGRNKLRPALTAQEIEENAKTYLNQVFMVLDKSKTHIHKNSNWLGAMDARDMLKLMSCSTLSQMLARDDFKNRFEAGVPVFLHEMMYPLLQASDSVHLQCDVELGGNDQTFNLLAGRELQKQQGQCEQAVVALPLLVGLDGEKKMSKSLGNHIGFLDSPEKKFGSIMSISDKLMWHFWQILALKSEQEVQAMQESGKNPRDFKLDLAQFVVSLFHSQEQAQQQRQNFIERFSKKQLTQVDTVEVSVAGEAIGLLALMKELSFAPSFTQGARLLQSGAVRLDGVKVFDKNKLFTKGSEFLLQVGKLHANRVRLV